MAVVLGIIIGVLFLVVLFLLAAEITLDSKVNTIRARQERLERELNTAKDQHRRDMQNNNKEIAKELSKLESNSMCFTGFSGKIPVSEVLFKFMGQLGYTLQGSEFKIIKKGDQGRGQVREERETVCKDEKAKKS